MTRGEPVSTRPATEADIPAITAMHRALAEHCSYPRFLHDLSEDRLQSAISGNGSTAYFVADHEFIDGFSDNTTRFREIGGFIHVGQAALSSLFNKHGLYVDDLYARPDLRHDHDVTVSLIACAARAAIKLADDNPDRAFLRIDSANRNNDPTLRQYTGRGLVAGNTNQRIQGEPLKALASFAHEYTTRS